MLKFAKIYQNRAAVPVDHLDVVQQVQMCLDHSCLNFVY